MINKFLKYKYSLSTLALLVIVFLLILIFRYEKNIEDDLFKVSTSDLFEITQNKANFIKRKFAQSESYIDDIKSDPKLRAELEICMKNILTKNIKYAYILYKDKNNIFRFLVDASPEDEKSMLNQKFDITSDKWYELYETKEPIVIEHQILQKLYISYLVPILNKKNVELVVVIDFSVDKISSINEIIVMMKTGVVLILSIVFITVSILLIQLFRYKSMKKSSFIDRLTNVYNRNYLHEIENEIDLSEYILMVFDIDHFKKINDTYGHDAGDIVLKDLGRILSSTLRMDEDIAIRYGGEEFIVLLRTKSENSEISMGIVDRIFNNIKEHKYYIDNDKFIKLTISIGVNKTPYKQEKFADAFKIADMALFEAKNGGRDMIKYSV